MYPDEIVIEKVKRRRNNLLLKIGMLVTIGS